MERTRPFVAMMFAVAVAGCTPASAQPHFTGLAQAKDGDSLMVGQREVRLSGIDAPEWDQYCTRDGKRWACGQEAASRLMRLVTGKEVTCLAVDTDEHGRTVARCTVGGTDVNRRMVESGYATAYRHYSAHYVGAEESAKRAKLGLWAGTFEPPSQYRRDGQSADRQAAPARKRSPAKPAPVQAVSGGCTIKGNQGSNGWIYHVPGMPFYERTKAEQMFCSEGEAVAAGYRRAKVR